MAHLRDRRAFGNIGTRKFRGARFGDPLSPRGPQYTLEGRVLDYSTDVGPFTIVDQSGEGNTATLYSGRGLTMDAVNDTVTYATGYSSASRTATLWGRFNTTSPVALVGSVSGFFLFTPTATGVWEELTATATVEGDLAWDLGLDFDIGDLRVGTEHWTHNDWSDPTADGLNGKTIVDSGPNGYHGTCTGCSGFTGEATIPQTADKNWNKRMWFSETDGRVAIPTSTALFDGGGTISATIVNFDNGARVWEQGAALGQAHRLLIGSSVGGFSTLTFRHRYSIGGDAIWTTDSAVVQTGKSFTVSVAYNSSSAANDPVITVDGVVAAITETVAPSGGRIIGDTDLFLGNSENFSAGFGGIISDVSVNASTYIGHGNSNADWVDQVGSNDGVVGGTTSNILVTASDANDQIDALGTAILEPRLNTQQLNLFGDGEYSSTPDSDSLDVTTEATWELWGNFYKSSAATEALIAKFGLTSGRSYAIYQIAAADGTLRFHTTSDGTQATGRTDDISITDKVSHVVFTYEAGVGISGYVDGQLVSTTTTGVLPASIYVGTDSFDVGSWDNGASGFCSRKIGSAKIYNVALTADEVLTNYNTQKSLYGL